jgi:hypothetical protein
MLLQHISFQCHQQFKSSDVVAVIVLYLDLQLHMQSVPITLICNESNTMLPLVEQELVIILTSRTGTGHHSDYQNRNWLSFSLVEQELVIILTSGTGTGYHSH